MDCDNCGQPIERDPAKDYEITRYKYITNRRRIAVPVKIKAWTHVGQNDFEPRCAGLTGKFAKPK